MARTKVVLPPDSTGQAMGVTTYSNGADTVAAPETVLVTPSGTPITPTTPSDTQPVSAATLPLPSGAATAAKQPALGTAGSASADVLSVQGISGGTVLPVSDGGGSLTIDGTVGVSGTVPVDSELTTADLDTGAGTDTRAVVGLIYGASGGGTLVSSTNPLPVGDNGGSLTVDGTFWQATQPVSGTFWQATQPVSGTVTANAGSGPFPVSDNSGSLTVDNGGTFAVQDSEKVTDNAAFTDGTTKVQPVGYVFDEVAGTALTENDTAAARVDSKRAQVLVLEDATTRGRRATVTAGGAVTVDGSATTQPVSGTFWQATQPVSGTVTASNVTGNVAHDGVDSGNPVLQGFQAIAHGTNPTAVAAADRTVGYANRAGIPFVMGGHPNIITRRDNFTAAQTNVALVTIATGLKIVVTRVLITCANSNSVDVSCTVGFGTANTPTGAGVVADHPGIPKGGGLNTGDGSGLLGVGADNEDLRITCSVPTGGSISVVTSYFTIES